MTPDEFRQHGHEVVVEKDAGLGSQIPDEEYVAAGATIIDSADDVREVLRDAAVGHVEHRVCRLPLRVARWQVHVDHAPLAEQVTAERVRGLFASRRPASVARYDLPRLHAFNFVLDAVLEGGVNASLGLDGHGKSLSFLLLAATVRIERGLLAGLDGAAASASLTDVNPGEDAT